MLCVRWSGRTETTKTIGHITCKYCYLARSHCTKCYHGNFALSRARKWDGMETCIGNIDLAYQHYQSDIPCHQKLNDKTNGFFSVQEFTDVSPLHI